MAFAQGHLLLAAVTEAAELRILMRDLQQHPDATRIAISPVTLAVATAASSLHTAVHAMSPVTSGLCPGDQLAATVETSLTAS